jgi:hypothetical protein
VALAIGLAVAAVLLVGCVPDEPETPASQPKLRRLTEAQYRNSIADIFGADIVIAGRFEPLIRPSQGLLEDASALTAVSQSGFEQYDGIARNIADQVVDERHRDILLPCQMPAADVFDAACAAKIYRNVGRLLFRRPSTETEVSTYVDMARRSASTVKDSNRGVALALAAMLVSPNFLFRVETFEPDPGKAGAQRLTAYSKAARLSFFLWNTTPSEELLDAAARGDLHDERKLRAITATLLDSPRWEQGVRAFFADMFMFEKFEELAKDPIVYPKFNPDVARDAKEQILRTVSNAVVNKDEDYRDVYTTRETFLTRPLGMVYRLPIETREGWEPVALARGDQRSGILGELGFLALYSHSGRSSPTLRGKAIRELLLCQKVPDPPGNVDFSVAQDTTNPHLKTARMRLLAHRTNPTCAGCHKIMDPIGLAMENFDGIGEFRATENGERIDASGDLDGKAFSDAAGLGAAMHDSPASVACLTRRAYEYAIGRPPVAAESAWLAYVSGRFAAEGYRFRELMSTIATSRAFFKAAPAQGVGSESVASEAHAAKPVSQGHNSEPQSSDLKRGEHS